MKAGTEEENHKEQKKKKNFFKKRNSKSTSTVRKWIPCHKKIEGANNKLLLMVEESCG